MCLTSGSESLRVVTLHRPPSIALSTFIEGISSLLEDHVLIDEPLIINRDFNVHWDNVTNPQMRILQELFFSFSLKQHRNVSAHRKGHILGYIETRESDSSIVTDTTVSDQVSDHNMVLCNISLIKPKHLREQLNITILKTLTLNHLEGISKTLTSCATIVIFH